MLIFEGTDKAGKTTFIKGFLKYARDIDYDLFHFGLLPDNWDYCEDYIRYVRSHFILDRFMDSERAYGPVYRGGVNPKLTTKNMNKVYMRCSQVGTVVVYCKPSIEEVEKRINAQGDLMIKKKEQIIALRNEFDNIYNSSYPLDVITVNTSKPIEEMDPQVYQNIFETVSDLQNEAEIISNLGYRGEISPKNKMFFYTNNILEDTTSFVKNANIETKERIKEYYMQDKPNCQWGLIYSKDTEGKPVNIDKLLNYFPKDIGIVVGKTAFDDWEKAKNTALIQS